jgi:hypothetical protein
MTDGFTEAARLAHLPVVDACTSTAADTSARCVRLAARVAELELELARARDAVGVSWARDVSLADAIRAKTEWLERMAR